MKIRNLVVFCCISILLFLTSCKTATVEQDTPLGETGTPVYTNTPQPSLTPTLTSTPTLTHTPTPTSTPMAGSGGVIVRCNQIFLGQVYYDLSTKEYQILFDPFSDGELDKDNYEPDQVMSKLDESLPLFLSLHGVSDELLNSFDNTFLDVNQDLHFYIFFLSNSDFSASNDGSEFVVDNYRNFIGVSEQDPLPKQILSFKGISFYDLFKSYQHVPSTDSFYKLEQNYSDVYKIQHPGNVITNITDDFEPMVNNFDVTRDGSTIALRTNQGIWIGKIESRDYYLAVDMPYVAPHHYHCDGPRWSYDSQRLVFINKSSIFISNADGSDVEEITYMLPSDYFACPQWTPDGQIIFWSKGNSAWSLIALDPDNGFFQNIITFPPGEIVEKMLDVPAVWSPDHKWYLLTVYHPDEHLLVDGMGFGEPQSYICSLENDTCVGLDMTTSEDEFFCSLTSDSPSGWVKNQP